MEDLGIDLSLNSKIAVSRKFANSGNIAASSKILSIVTTLHSKNSMPAWRLFSMT